jgi:hypothetical protein
MEARSSVGLEVVPALAKWDVFWAMDVLEAGRLASYEWMWGMLGGHRLASPMSGDGARLSSCSWQGRHAWEVSLANQLTNDC